MDEEINYMKEKYRASVGMGALLLLIGIGSIADDHLSKGWLAAKVVAVAVLAFGLGMGYAQMQRLPQKKKK
jgi:uncharacterized membrane protein